MKCPVCGHALVDDFVTPKVDVKRCPSCAHRVARFARLPSPKLDYYEEHGQAAYVDALGLTRLRQAERILSGMKRSNLSLNNLFDFGAGRAWFVRTLIDHGAQNIAGGDSSDISLKILETLGATGIRCEFVSNDVRFGPIPFDVKTVSFLDVIEHFPVDELNSVFSKILARFPALETVIVKVPVSDGIFYRASTLARRFLHRAQWIEQLFQVHTNIPHFHYFSRASLALFLKKNGFATLAVINDVEVDDIAGRAKMKGIPRTVGTALNGALAMCAHIIGCDARIVIAKRS